MLEVVLAGTTTVIMSGESVYALFPVQGVETLAETRPEGSGKGSVYSTHFISLVFMLVVKCK